MTMRQYDWDNDPGDENDYPQDRQLEPVESDLEYRDRVVEDFLNVAEEFLEFGTKAQLIQMLEDNF